MYSNNKNNNFDNTITVTPIKVEMNISPTYNNMNNNNNTSVAMAATTSTRRNAHQQQTQANTVNMIPIVNSSATISYTMANTAATIAAPKEKLLHTPKSTRGARPQASQQGRKCPPTIDNFWPNVLTEVRNIQLVDAKHQALPLARIKKIMRLDENAKMIAAEAPLLFAKACEYFIQELSMRAWIHTEESKRRTLQRSDIAQAIANYDQFDFLIDIVPREDIKPTSSSQKRSGETQNANNNNTLNEISGSCQVNGLKIDPAEQIISFNTLNTNDSNNIVLQQHQHTPHQQQQTQVQSPPQQHHLQIMQPTTSGQQQLQYFITIPNQQVTGQPQLVQQLQLQQQHLPSGLNLNLAVAQPQQLILTTGPNGQLTATTAAQQQQQQTALLHNLAQQQQQQHIQLLQQVVTPTCELTNMPITINANQLNLLRLQAQQQQHDPCKHR